MPFWSRIFGRKRDAAPPPARKAAKLQAPAAKRPRSSPVTAYPQANVGSLLKRAKANPDRAIADCTKALDMNPRDAAALCCRALARQAKNDGAGAKMDADAALEIDSCQAS